MCKSGEGSFLVLRRSSASRILELLLSASKAPELVVSSELELASGSFFITNQNV